jgi:hypothetical protein
LFWLFDHIATVCSKRPRPLSLAVDVLLDAAHHVPGLYQRIEDAIEPLFTPAALEGEQVRECAVRALVALLGVSFDVTRRGRSEESMRILDKFLSGKPGTVIARWIIGQFSTQCPSALSAAGFAVEHLAEWADIILDKDEMEEDIARTALMGISASNWLGALCELPLTQAAACEWANTMVDILLPDKHVWQVQPVLLLMTETFLASVFFFLDEAILEGMINDRVVPGLLHQHPDVQDAAAQLLTFVVKSSSQLAEKLDGIVEIFKRMLIDKESFSRRIAGAKGLGSIISGTIMFDEVPSYVFDSFTALADALEVDSGLDSVISQFFSDFWAMYDSNLATNIAEMLAPFRASLRPSYFC